MTDKKKKTPPKIKAITLKQRVFLKVYLETGNATEAAMEAYNCKDKNSARALGSETLTSLSNGPIKERMDAAGLTDEYLMSIIHDGLTSEKVEVAKFQGSIGGEKAYADHQTRARYAELALKWKGELKDRLIHEGSVPVTFDGDNPKDYIKSHLDD